MTVIRPNSISGITSITAQANEINVFKSDGTLAGLSLNGVNVNTTTGISTYAALNVTGNISIGGTLTYQDVTNVDSLGIGTFRAGIDISGGQLDLDDNIKIRLGTGNDYEIYHDGSNAVHRVTGDGDLKLLVEEKNFIVQGTGGHQILKGIDNGAVELYHNNSKKFETWSGGSQVHGSLHTDELFLQDNEKIKVGTGTDLEIFHDGSHSKLKNSTGFLVLESDSFALNNGAGSENIIKGFNGGAVELYHNNTKRFETTSAGVSVNGNVILGDAEELQMGNSTDFQIFHGGTNSHIVNSTNELKIRSNDVRLQNAAGNENYFVGFANSYSAMYYDNSKKLETHDDGVVLNGLDQSAVAHNQYDNLVLGNTGSNAGLTIVSGTNNAGTVAWSDGSSGAGGYRGYIEYYHDTEQMHLACNSGVVLELRTDQIRVREHILPNANNTYDIGSSSERFRNIYTNDLNLSNKGSANSIDNTWGDYTIQEGESDLFLINNRSGKKYKFNLTEVS